MLLLPPSVKVFVWTQPADLRRQLDGLAALTKDLLRKDPFSGHLFVFFNRRRDRVKVLYWDTGGFALWYKRLERGVFRFPRATDGSLEMEAGDLALILDRIDPSSVKRQPRFVPKAAS